MVDEGEIEKKDEEIVDIENDSSHNSAEHDPDEAEEELDEDSHSVKPLTEEEIEELISELLEVESNAAEAQETLEEESLSKVEADVRKELAQSLLGDELDKAVSGEMAALREQWEVELDELETEIAHLLEQLDGAGIDLSSLYKWIERQAPNGCCTEAWKKRTHWAGTNLSVDASESVTKAEQFLQVHRPVRRRHGKVLEEGASGFMGKKVEKTESSEALNDSTAIDWDSFSKMCSGKSSLEDISFGSKLWASVYLASTPQQAAELGLKFPGVDEVEEIDDIDGTSYDPFIADAIANEGDLNLNNEHKQNFKKVKEEDDANADRKLHIHLKQRRRRKQYKEDITQGDLSSSGGTREHQPDGLMGHEEGDQELNDNANELSGTVHVQRATNDLKASASVDVTELRGIKHSSEYDVSPDSKKPCTVTMDSDGEDPNAGNEAFDMEEATKLDGQLYLIQNLIQIQIQILGNMSAGYIVNVVREEGEEAVRIPPSISTKLKIHQVAGIRFMWENIIQSVRKVMSGDKGLGCILAHTMGLGKTFQVIAFLYTAMRSVDLGLRTALIVTPVSVLHNWRHEFMKWKPSELKPLRIFMVQDVTREKRGELFMKWRIKGGVFLIGYTAFRNLSLGKYAKDRDMAREISQALQEGPDILVCDEAHIIKNTRADTTQALKQVKCQRRIARTGSPLQNNLMEYYCMVDFVREGFLGSSHEFRNRFQNPIEMANTPILPQKM